MTRPPETATAGKRQPPENCATGGNTTTGATPPPGEMGARAYSRPSYGRARWPAGDRPEHLGHFDQPCGRQPPCPASRRCARPLGHPGHRSKPVRRAGRERRRPTTGPGHYPGTPLPGQPGNVGIAGHRTTFGAPFFRLNEVSRGDLVLLTDTSGTTWVYDVVRQWVVDPSDTAVLDTTRAPMLTLTTCNPRFEGHVRGSW